MSVKLERAVQIGIVVDDLDRVTNLLTNVFGIGPFRFIEWPNRPETRFTYQGKEEHIKLRQAFVQVGPLELEFIQPLEGDRNAYKEFLDRTGGGIHHLLFETSDLPALTADVAKSGIEVLQTGTGIRPGTHWALLDTLKGAGLYIELRHRPPGGDGTSTSGLGNEFSTHT